MVDEVQERRRLKAKITSQPDENDHLNQIKFLTQENNKLKIENASQKEQIKKLQVNLASRETDFKFAMIDRQLKTMQEVTPGYMNVVLEKMTATECECFLNREDEKGETFLHQLIRISRVNDSYVNEELKDYEKCLDDNYDLFPKRYGGNYHELIELLLMKGANPDSKTREGQTCLHLATEEKFDDDDDGYFRNPVIIKLLLQYGANTELKDDNTGNTALHNALCSFSETVINLLVDHGADCNALTRNGETVVQHAVTISARELFEYYDHEWMAEREARCKMMIALWKGGADEFYYDIFGDLELIDQAAKDNLNNMKIIKEESCVICYSKTPVVTFFPCGHKVFCSDCQKISTAKSCACCRQKILFYTVDVEKKAVEVAPKLTKMTLRKR